MVFVILGRNFSISRKEMKKLIISNGGKISEKITNQVFFLFYLITIIFKVTHLLYNGTTFEQSMTFQKAKEKGIFIITECHLQKLLHS